MRKLVLLRMVASPLQLPPLTVCCAWFSSCTASASSTHGQLCMVQQFHLFSFTSSASSTHGLLHLFGVRHFSFLHARSAAPLQRPPLQLPPRTVCCLWTPPRCLDQEFTIMSTPSRVLVVSVLDSS